MSWWNGSEWWVFSRVRVTRAFPGNFDLLLSQPSQKGSYFCQNTGSLSGSWMEEFPNFWALVEYLLALFSICLTNFVPNRVVIIWIWLFYRGFCEGCESKKLKIAVVRAYTRAREFFLCFHDMWRTPSFFLLDFRERFWVIFALELLCDEAVCLMKSINFVRLLIASSSKGWKNRATSAKKTPTFYGKSPTFFQKRGRFSSIARTFLSGGLQYSFSQHFALY